jgi:hypothetical protein
MRIYGFMLRKENDNFYELDKNHKLIEINAKTEQNAFIRLAKNYWEVIETHNYIEIMGEIEKR